MLILITSEKDRQAEKKELVELFKSGLALLHVRKPGISEDAMRTWLSQFEKNELNKMVLHEHHHLAKEFELKGIHLTEKAKMENSKNLESYITSYRSEGFSVSASYHRPEKISFSFDYSFLSPVFNSISKSAYKGKGFRVSGSKCKIIALGGITSENIQDAKLLGYDGAAVLGSVWKGENPLKSFQQIQKACSNEFI